MADFQQSCNKIQNLIQSLNRDINKRVQLIQQGQSTGKIDMDINGQLKTLDNDILKLQQLTQQQEQDPKKFSITQQEAKRRQNVCTDLMNKQQETKTNYQNSGNQQNAKKVFFDDKKQERFIDKYDAQNLTNQQIHDAKQLEEQQQEQKLDVLIGVTQNLKKTGQDINKELDHQDPLLQKLGNNIDRNNDELVKANTRMNKLVLESSKCCLLITILVEIVVLILIIVL